MEVTTGKMATVVFTFGFISFLLGIVAEHKKPPFGIPTQGKGVVICKYPADPTVALGYSSFGFLMASSLVGCLSIFYPYKGTSVSSTALLKYTSLSVFFTMALPRSQKVIFCCIVIWIYFGATSAIAATWTLWATITEQLHWMHNAYPSAEADCPTAKTGVLGGAASMSLLSSVLWLCSLDVVDNAREDYYPRF